MKIIEKQCADMLVALAAAKKEPSLRMKRNDMKPGTDICVLVDATTGDFVDKERVDPMDPKTWPFVVMLFGSDIAAHQRRVKKGDKSSIPICSRFYAWDPFGPPPTTHMIYVGDDIPPSTALVKVAERQTSLKAV